MATSTTKRVERGVVDSIVHALTSRRGGAMPIAASVTINRPLHEVFLALRHIENLPSFMTSFATVKRTGPKTARWTLELPTNAQLDWDVELVEERLDEKLDWHAIETSRIPADLEFRFVTAPARDATEVHAVLELHARPALPAALLKLFVREKLKADLRRLKQILETGEVLYSDASLHRGRHPAQPSGDEGAAR